MEELEQAKQAALKQLEKLNLKKQKAAFVKKINDAKTVEEVTAVMSDAQKASDQNDKDDAEAAQMEKAKKEALKKVEVMNLKDQKQAFLKLVTDAKTLEEVKQIVAKAQEVSDKNDKGDATVVNKEAFIERKITVLNTKSGSICYSVTCRLLNRKMRNE